MNPSPHKLSRLLPLLLTLLLAQVGAQAHAYSHLQQGSRQDRLAAGARRCADCCLAAPLLNAVGPAGVQQVARVDAFATWVASRPTPYVAAFQPPEYRSRAPPDSP